MHMYLGLNPISNKQTKYAYSNSNGTPDFVDPYCAADRPSYCYAMLIIRNKQGPQKFLIEKTSQASFTNPQQCVSLIFDIFS